MIKMISVLKEVVTHAINKPKIFKSSNVFGQINRYLNIKIKKMNLSLQGLCNAIFFCICGKAFFARSLILIIYYCHSLLFWSTIIV